MTNGEYPPFVYAYCVFPLFCSILFDLDDIILYIGNFMNVVFGFSLITLMICKNKVYYLSSVGAIQLDLVYIVS